MSDNTNEDIMPKAAGAGSDAPTPRKRAAKKAVAKTAEKKVPVKKAAAKKVAVKKAAAPSAPELPFTSAAAPIPNSAETPAARPARASRAKKSTLEPTSNEVAPASSNENRAQTSEETPRRFGRVPGGGPVSPREVMEPPTQQLEAPPAAPHSPAPQEAREFAPSPQPRQERVQERPDRQPHDGQQRSPQQRDGQPSPNSQNQPNESRSKRRRDKRKRRNNERQEQGGQAPNRQQNQQNHPNRQRHDGGKQPSNNFDQEDRRPIQLNGPKIEANGMLELAPKGFGFLRVPGKNFEQARDDVFVTPETIRKYNLRLGQWIHGLYQDGPRGPQLVEITTINDMTPDDAGKLPHFDELKAINPTRRISFETTPERYTTRVIDIMAPVGRGQRGLIVSPPRSGKTTLLLHMAEAIREKYDEAIHLMVVLVDERPEEVTEFRRALPGAEIYASSNDEQARNHCRIAELAIERAKRLVEAGKDVFLLMDSITRLARAYNGNMNNRGRGTGSGGITIGALEIPRRLFAAARNTRGGGSLTILATALIQTNSRADEAIFMEFKGTGNMELVLDRKIAENYIYPAVDIFKSGTRREELLLADHMLHKIHLIRRGLSGHRPAEAMERLLFFLKKFPNNPQMLMEIKG